MSRRHLSPHPLPRAPRAHVDPIDDAPTALALIDLATADPPRHETIAFLLDDDGRGGAITVVSGTVDPDAVVAVVEVLCRAAAADPRLCSLVVASVRPDSATLPGDVDRWLEASALADTFGIELIEWFVVGPAGAECPRDLLGEPERW